MLAKIQTILEQKPGLKAKVIAKELHVETKELNKILHAEKELFVQDPKEYTWSLTALRIDLGSGNWLDAESFEQRLVSVGSPLESTIPRVTFVVGEGCNILLDALARLLAISNQLAASGKSVSLNFTAASSTLGYLNRIGFIDLLRDDINILPKRPEISAAAAYKGKNMGVVELREIDYVNPDNEIPSLLRSRLVSCAGEQYDVAAHTVITELFGNAIEHSGATTAGFAGLQYYSGGKRPHIQTVISDSGRGIVGTLMPIIGAKYPDVARRIAKSTIDPRIALLQEVFSKGEISQVDDSGRGLGLKRSGQCADKYKAVISVRQETLELKIEHIRGRITFSYHTGLAKIAGTHICFDFLLDRTENTR